MQILALVLFALTCLAQETTLVETSLGTIKGMVKNNAKHFLGIPYAGKKLIYFDNFFDQIQ